MTPPPLPRPPPQKLPKISLEGDALCPKNRLGRAIRNFEVDNVCNTLRQVRRKERVRICELKDSFHTKRVRHSDVISGRSFVLGDDIKDPPLPFSSECVQAVADGPECSFERRGRCCQPLNGLLGFRAKKGSTACSLRSLRRQFFWGVVI